MKKFSPWVAAEYRTQEMYTALQDGVVVARFSDRADMEKVIRLVNEREGQLPESMEKKTSKSVPMWRCPICWTYGQVHSMACRHANSGMDHHVRVNPPPIV